MPDDISATGWLVILCALALGFGLVRFLLVQMQDRSSGLPPQPYGDAADPPKSAMDEPPNDQERR
jgi:hypothetical protein